MSHALDAASYVYQGLWINWSKGKIYGATLTLSPSNATLLVSVLAIFVQMTGSQLWTIVQLVLHQRRSTKELMDGFYHQQQAILRNIPSDLSAAWQLLRVYRAWRHHKATKPLRRSVALVAWSLLHLVLFAVAGVFSATLIDAGDEVLSRSPYCSSLFKSSYFDSMGNHSTLGMPDAREIEYYVNEQTRYQQSQEYVDFCNGTSENSATCNTFLKRRLNGKSSIIHGSCPFDPSICSADAPTMAYDTGYLSSHHDLGLNAKEQDRIWYRKTSACTVFNDTSFTSDWEDIQAPAGSPVKRVVDIFYGPSSLADRNATYSFSEWDQYDSFDQYTQSSPYQINVQYAAAGDAQLLDSSFMPIPQLRLADADLMLVFLSFSKAYDSIVTDPWYSATMVGAYPLRNNETINGTIYQRERLVTTLGCTEQHQICTGGAPPASTCTAKLGWMQITQDPRGMTSLNLTVRQAATYQQVFQSAVDSRTFLILRGLTQRDTPLLSRRLIQGLVGLGLPDDQWQRETDYWHSIALTHLQRTVIGHSTGEFAANTDYIELPSTPADKWVCQNLITRGTPYQSFNFFALILIFVIGVLIVAAGLVVEDTVAWWFGPNTVGQQMWKANEMLEAQATAYENAGFGIWRPSANGVPVCGPDKKMGVLRRRAKLQGVSTDALQETEGSSGTLEGGSNLPLQWLEDAQPLMLRDRGGFRRFSYPLDGGAVRSITPQRNATC